MSEEVTSKKRSMPGPQRAALFLMALGEHEAAEILKHMGPKEVQLLGTTMTAMHDIRQEQIASVLDDFVEHVGNQTSLSIGAEDYLRKVLKKALGNEKANSIMSRISLGVNSKGLEALKWMDPKAVSEIIKNEHPQIIAIVLIYLENEHAAQVLKFLPEELRSDIIMRIAKLDGVHPSALSELDALMDRRVDVDSEVKLANIGGYKVAASILNGVPPNVESSIFEKLGQIDADLTQRIQDQMFIFENLLQLDDRGMQILLREISSDALVVALRGTSIDMQEKVFKNMSKRAAEMLRDDLETRGPVRLAEVEEAQKNILTVARKLSEEGQIMLGSGGDDFV